jgi:hypothetical protein
MKKSQASIGFLFAIGIIIFIFLMVFAFTFNRDMELRDSKVEINKRNTCLLVSSLITSAFISGEGVIIDTSIEYNVSIEGTDFKEMDVENKTYCLLAIDTVHNERLEKGAIEIKNTNNDIDIKNV